MTDQPKPRRRILCCCEGGNTRSVTLATLLKYNFGPSRGHDAVAVSLAKNGDTVLSFLMEWAQDILLVDVPFMEDIPVPFRHKVKLVPIGRDMWGQSMHPELVPLAHRLLVEAGYRPRKAVDEIVKKGTKYDRRRRGEAE